MLLGCTTSQMLHRCKEAFLVQSFFNLILKDNTIVVCFCPIRMLTLLFLPDSLKHPQPLNDNDQNMLSVTKVFYVNAP